MIKKTISTICNLLGSIILVAIILIAGSMLVLQLLGYQPMAILSGSMEPNYNVGGLVFINTNVSPEDMTVGDVIAFRRDEDTIVTHRIYAIEDNAFITKGDNNEIIDAAPVSFDTMIGQAWLHIPHIGTLMSNLRTIKGAAVAAIVLALLIVLFVVPILLAPPKEKKKETLECNI